MSNNSLEGPILSGVLFIGLSLCLLLNNKKKELSKKHAKKFVFCIHGGAGVIAKTLDSAPYKAALASIVNQVYKFSSRPNLNITAVDVVEFAVNLLENEPLFNSGKGAVYTSAETHELDASIMDGSNLACGAVSLVKDVKNPISLARRVMEGTPHVFFAGSECTSQYASQFGLEKVDPSYFDTETRLRQLHEAKNREVIALDHNLPTKNDSNTDSADTCAKVVHTQNDGTGKGTVGCVCMFNGHVAAGTSTGGMTNKACGRVGDTPVIGAGTYANDKAAAISATGHGEEFIRHCASFDVISRMTLGGLSLHSAMKETVFNILPDKSGGLIGVDAHGNVSMQFNCGGMFRGTCHSGGEASIGIWDEDENIQIKV